MLQTTGLDAGYRKGSPVVRDIDLTLERGEIVALLGPNGAGKTTILETLAGLLPALGGEVTVDDATVRPGDPRSAVRAGLVLVPDDRALFRGLTCEQNLRLAVRSYRRSEVRARLDQALEWFPALGKRMKVDAGQVSGGEQQMLAIARALLQRPKVLLVDELSMGLAPVIVESILPVLRSVAQSEGTAMVLVEQHVRLALEAADRAVVLVHGNIAFQCPAAELAGDLGRLEAAYLGASA